MARYCIFFVFYCLCVPGGLTPTRTNISVGSFAFIRYITIFLYMEAVSWLMMRIICYIVILQTNYFHGFCKVLGSMHGFACLMSCAWRQVLWVACFARITGLVPCTLLLLCVVCITLFWVGQFFVMLHFLVLSAFWHALLALHGVHRVHYVVWFRGRP